MKRSFLNYIVVFLVLSLSFATFACADGSYFYNDENTIKKVQEALNAAGYDCGSPDGISGKKTQSAIEKYKVDHDLEDTSTEITYDLLVSLGIEEMPEIITTGFYRRVADNLNPMISLSETSDTLFIECYYGNEEGLNHIPEFFEILCKMIYEVSVWKDYKNITASFIAKDTLEAVLVNTSK